MATSTLEQLLNTQFSSDYVTKDYVDESISDYVTKEYVDENFLALSGGSVSGNVEIYKDTLNIYAGNYIQSDADPSIMNYSVKNVFVQGESAPTEGQIDSYGQMYAGTKGYCILSIDVSNKVIKLSGDISRLASLYNDPTHLQDRYNEIPGAHFPRGSKALKLMDNDNFNTNITNASQLKYVSYLHTQGSAPETKILAVDSANSLITVDFIPEGINNRLTASTTSADYQTKDGYLSDWVDDDNSFYCPGLPELGNQLIPSFSGQHAEGGSDRAIGKFAHVEGRDNFADGKFSHAEGTCNYAARIASHVEGRYCQAIGEYSHAAGMLAKASDRLSYVWNGNIDSSDSPSMSEQKSSNGAGTYNIYPKDGLAGFFIDGQSLQSILGSRDTSLKEGIRNALSGITDEVVVSESARGTESPDSLMSKMNTIAEALLKLKAVLQ